MKSNIIGRFCKGGGRILVDFPAENDFVAQEKVWVFAYTLTVAKEFPQPVYLKIYTFIKADKDIQLLCYMLTVSVSSGVRY